MTTKLYFATEPSGGVCLYRETIAQGAQRVAHIPLEMSLDERDQRLLADEWLLSAQHPAALPALAVRRIVARQRAETRLGAAIVGLCSKAPANG